MAIDGYRAPATSHRGYQVHCQGLVDDGVIGSGETVLIWNAGLHDVNALGLDA